MMNELHYPTTRYILTKFVIYNRLGKDAPDWACGRLIAGDDTPHLAMLAGMTGSENAFELEDYFRRTIHELHLQWPDNSKAVLDYAREISRLYLDGQLPMKLYLQEFIELHYAEGAGPEIYPFYMLAHAWNDFQYSEFSYYYDVTQENFEEALLREIDQLMAGKLGNT